MKYNGMFPYLLFDNEDECRSGSDGNMRVHSHIFLDLSLYRTYRINYRVSMYIEFFTIYVIYTYMYIILCSI